MGRGLSLPSFPAVTLTTGRTWHQVARLPRLSFGGAGAGGVGCPPHNIAGTGKVPAGHRTGCAASSPHDTNAGKVAEGHRTASAPRCVTAMVAGASQGRSLHPSG